jgi:hypothetical protein
VRQVIRLDCWATLFLGQPILLLGCARLFWLESVTGVVMVLLAYPNSKVVLHSVSQTNNMSFFSTKKLGNSWEILFF